MKVKIFGVVILGIAVFSTAYSMDSALTAKDQKSNVDVKGENALDRLKERFNRSYLCDNFAEVCEKKLYRAGSLTIDRLEHYIEIYNIKIVINLRNCQPEAKWWQNMSITCKQKGVQLIDIETSCTEPVKKDVFEKLIKIFKETYEPILIVDKGGVVRTGEISALWLLINWNEQEIKNLLEKAIADAFKTRTQNALGQLSILNGYFLEGYYGKKAEIENFGDCIAKKLAHDFVSKLDLKDPFQSTDFIAAFLDGVYSEKNK